jgi:hypothetical protein
MSLSQYVIICRTKINFVTVKDVPAKIRALSDGAAFLLAHIEITHPGELMEADVKPISDLQHKLMDGAASITKDQIEAHALTMFGLLEALEDKFSGESKKGGRA